VVARIRIDALRSQDSALWESGIRARALPEPKASTLGVILQIYSSHSARAASRVHLHHCRTHAADVLRAVWLDWRRVEEVEADGLLPSMAALACPSIR